ncbi:MAG: hypothetical protein IPK97_18065 [Ahniella sp.]|nr:hypothetical protein [Ahniella sp.]
MSHLLIAKDGPSGTLIVQSLVDGNTSDPTWSCTCTTSSRFSLARPAT